MLVIIFLSFFSSFFHFISSHSYIRKIVCWMTMTCGKGERKKKVNRWINEGKKFQFNWHIRYYTTYEEKKVICITYLFTLQNLYKRLDTMVGISQMVLSMVITRSVRIALCLKTLQADLEFTSSDTRKWARFGICVRQKRWKKKEKENKEREGRGRIVKKKDRKRFYGTILFQ